MTQQAERRWENRKAEKNEIKMEDVRKNKWKIRLTGRIIMIGRKE